MKFLDWGLDYWFSMEGSLLPYDKLEHFLLGWFGMAIFVYFFRWGLVRSFVVVFVIAVCWEVKDGILPYAGDMVQGFSWKDLIAGLCGGICCGQLMYELYR